MRHIILLGHKMFRGKDTAALHLIEKYDFFRVAFADSLREHVGKLYNLSWEQMSTELKSVTVPRLKATPRKILQDFGAEQRARDKDIWARLACEKIECTSKNIVVTDFRFPNEYDFLKNYFPDATHSSSYKITPIKINRSSLDTADLPGSDNISETALNNFQHWDYELENNSTIEDLYEQLDAILEEVRYDF